MFVFVWKSVFFRITIRISSGFSLQKWDDDYDDGDEDNGRLRG